jgi:uncharacterized protein (TIGR00255 family)
MLKSMTGFGRGEYSDSAHRFTVEIKSVNHRYNEISIRMPKNLAGVEDKIRRKIGAVLRRGRIDVFITLDEFGERGKTVRVDKELAIAYHKAIRELAEILNLGLEKENVYQIAKYHDVFKVEDTAEEASFLWPKIEAAIELAVNNLMSMRLAEGENLGRDFNLRLDKMDEYIDSISEKAPLALSEYREKLFSRMRDILANIGAEPDEARLLTEAAIYADRTNFTEEITRLKSHLAQFRSSLDATEAIGRKLDFIVQEINREINTIASKANDFTISNIAIDLKSEIEKIREQIQNIE